MGWVSVWVSNRKTKYFAFCFGFTSMTRFEGPDADVTAQVPQIIPELPLCMAAKLKPYMSSLWMGNAPDQRKPRVELAGPIHKKRSILWKPFAIQAFFKAQASWSSIGGKGFYLILSHHCVSHSYENSSTCPFGIAECLFHIVSCHFVLSKIVGTEACWWRARWISFAMLHSSHQVFCFLRQFAALLMSSLSARWERRQTLWRSYCSFENANVDVLDWCQGPLCSKTASGNHWTLLLGKHCFERLQTKLTP